MEQLEPDQERPVASRPARRVLALAAAAVAATGIIAVLLVQPGDGSEGEGDPRRAADETTASSSASNGGETAPVGGGATTTVPGPSATAGATSTTQRPTPSAPSSPDDYKYQVTLSANCVRGGEPLTVVMHLEPQAVGSMMILYADNQNHRATHYGTAAADGTLSHTFTVTPTSGKATVYTSAQRRSDGKGGTTTATFEVVGTTQSC